MADQRLLHREKTIRAAGLLFLLAPFMNLFMVIVASDVPDKWTYPMIWEFMKAGTTIQWIMQVATMVVGTLMLKGRRNTWMPVLVVLFVFIAHGVLTFKAQQARVGTLIPAMSMLINISLFVLVYWQEYWQISQGGLQNALRKMSANAPKMPEVPSMNVHSKLKSSFGALKEKVSAIKMPEVKIPGINISLTKKVIQDSNRSPELPKAIPEILSSDLPKANQKNEISNEIAPSNEIHQTTSIQGDDLTHQLVDFDLTMLIGMTVEFEGVGPWGQLINATKNDLVLQTFAKAPKGIENQPVEIEIANAGVLQFRLTYQTESLAVFRLEKVLPPHKMVG